GISIATYLNGAFVESFTANDPLVRVTLLSGSADVAFIGFPSTAAFNEVRISVGGLINASVLGDFIVYYAYVRADSDGDGVPDCLDKCCAGDDQLDGDGNGIPDACDGMPVAVNDTFELFVEDPVVLDVLANDDFGPDLPGTNAIRIVLLPENGVATVNDNGTPADPTDDFIDYLPAAGYQGVDSLRYLIEDSNGSTDTATVRFIIELNDAPEAMDDAVPAFEDTPLTISVLDNDIDVDGPDTLLTVVQGVVNGDLMLNADGTFTYTPDGNFNGLDSFRYSYCDNGMPNQCDTATVIITVAPVNDAPVAVGDVATADEDIPVVIDVLANDMDEDGPDTLLTIVQDVMNGDLVINGDGTITYTPDPDFNGQDSFTYSYCDGGAPNLCDTVTVMITINAVDDLPVVGDDIATTDENVAVNLSVLVNDSFGGDGPGTGAITITVPPSNGVATINNGGTLNDPTDDSVDYTPDANYTGPDSFEYQICDADGDCDQGTVMVTVNPEMVAPSEDCNNPLAGKNAIVDEISPGLVGLLLAGSNLGNVVNEDLEDFVDINITAAVLGTAIVSVKDISETYPAGRRAGFVLQSNGGLLSASALSGLSIRTYLNDVPQETATFSGGLLDLAALGNAGGKQRLGFTTTLPFDEIELYLSSTLTLLGSVRVFYAFEEDPLCDADCQTAIIPSNGFTPSIVGARTSFSGGILCIGCSITSTGDAIDDNLGNNASFNYGISVGETFTLSVDIGAAQPAGSDVGFVVAPDGILGLLDLSVLSTMRIRTYLGGAPVENVQLDQNLVSVDLLPGGRQSLSFRTSAPYDEVQLVTTSGVSLLGGLDIFNAFIRYDTDLDGVPDCIDKCVGDDNILNSAGLPLACNPECMLNAGVDISSCPEFGTGQAQLPPAMAGQTWSADPGNPSPATVDALGVVTGLSVEGIYTFILSDGVCSDTVQVNYVVSGTDLACNDPLVGPGVIVDDEMTFTGICILCADADASNVVDTDLENFLEYDDLVSLLVQSSLVSVKDTNNTYPAGTRVGYVIEFPTGLLDLNVLSSVQLVTYLDNQQQEIASSASLLGVGLLGAGENLQRIGFTTSLPFDEVEIVYNPTVGALSTLRVYYAFTEAPGCPFSVDPLVDPGALCIEPIIASADYCGRINYDETGINDLLCVACTIEPL
ncbi:tandem-95 repeat protein, partial [Lewinella lacunae]